MTRILLTTTLAGILGAGSIVTAQAPAKPEDHAAHHSTNVAGPPAATPEKSDAQAPGQGHMMGGANMAGGMMGGGMMGGGMCPMILGGANTKVDVKKIEKGVTYTVTSSDPTTVTRLQKMAEAMRLMHEATSP